MVGSRLGSQWRQTSRDALRQSATIIAVRWHAERRWATYRDASGMPSKQRVAGSNPAGRASQPGRRAAGNTAAKGRPWALRLAFVQLHQLGSPGRIEGSQFGY